MSTEAKQHDHTEIVRALQLILGKDQVTELRALDAVTKTDRRAHIESGYFDDPVKLAAAVANIVTAKGIYFVVNPINPALLARAANRIRPPGKEPTTTDKDIIARRWLMVDIDPGIAAGISATNSEHGAAIELAYRMRDELSAEGWPEPIVADSGNGAHLLYRIDEPVDDDGLVQRVLKGFAERFGDKVDTTVHNPARIWKLYGTQACKGDSTPERPHRTAKILEVPESLIVVTPEQLMAIQAAAPPEPNQIQNRTMPNGQSLDLEQWIRGSGLVVDGPSPWQGGLKWVFQVCPWDGSHTHGSAFILQHASGAISAGCHHNSCQGKDWQSLRDIVEPERRRQTASTTKSAANTRQVKLIEKYQPFPVDVLPETVRKFVVETSSAIGCDSSYVALPLLGVVARAVGNSRVIRLKATWHEPAIIWGAIVGKSGTQKSPALQAALSPLRRKQAEAIAKHAEEKARYSIELAQYERDLSQWKRSKSADPPPWEPKEPVCERYIVGDVTIEAMGDRLAGQRNGLLMAADELVTFLDGMNQYKGGKGSDCGHWLTTWKGDPLTIDRKTGVKTLHIPMATVSVVGGIQPGILRRALGREHMQDGLCARLLLAMPEPRKIRWTEATVAPATEAALVDLLDSLLSLEPAGDENGAPIPFPIPLSPAAKGAWIENYNRHRIVISEIDDDDLAAAATKLEAYTARFALIIELCTNPGAELISQAAIQAAIELATWFGRESRRVYAMLAETDDDREARRLIDWIVRKGGAVTTRDVQMGCRWLQEPGDAETALNELYTAGLAVWEHSPPGQRGRPTRHLKLSTLSTVNGNGLSHLENGNTVDVDNVDTSKTPAPVDQWGEV